MVPGRNASENPAGIETQIDGGRAGVGAVATHQKTQQGLKLQNVYRHSEMEGSRNASENPAGIETLVVRVLLYP